jgi:hypothetical protein
MQGHLTESFYPFANAAEVAVHESGDPHPDVAHTHWGDELVALDDAGDDVYVARRGRRPQGAADLSDWGRAMVAAFKYPSRAAVAGGGNEGAEGADGAAAATAHGGDAGAARSAHVLRAVAEAQTGATASREFEMEGGFEEDEEARLVAGAAAAAAKDGGARAAAVAAAVSDAAVQEQARPHRPVACVLCC